MLTPRGKGSPPFWLPYKAKWDETWCIDTQYFQLVSWIIEMMQDNEMHTCRLFTLTIQSSYELIRILLQWHRQHFCGVFRNNILYHKTIRLALLKKKDLGNSSKGSKQTGVAKTFFIILLWWKDPFRPGGCQQSTPDASGLHRTAKGITRKDYISFRINKERLRETTQQISVGGSMAYKMVAGSYKEEHHEHEQ